MKFQYCIPFFLFLFCLTCQKEEKKSPINLDQLRKIEKEIHAQKVSNCKSDIEKKLCAHKWYFDFKLNQENTFLAKNQKNTKNDFPLTFLCDGTVFFMDVGKNPHKKVFWKIENDILTIETIPFYLESKHHFEFEINQENALLKIKNISKSAFHFSTYFIGTGCQG